jgi:hypothetical protein
MTSHRAKTIIVARIRATEICGRCWCGVGLQFAKRGAQGKIVDRLRPPFGKHQRTECIRNRVRPANLERVEAYPIDVRPARLSNYSDLHLLDSAPSESAFVRCPSCLTQRPADLALEFGCDLDEQFAGLSQFARLPSYTRAVA